MAITESSADQFYLIRQLYFQKPVLASQFLFARYFLRLAREVDSLFWHCLLMVAFDALFHQLDQVPGILLSLFGFANSQFLDILPAVDQLFIGWFNVSVEFASKAPSEYLYNFILFTNIVQIYIKTYFTPSMKLTKKYILECLNQNNQFRVDSEEQFANILSLNIQLDISSSHCVTQVILSIYKNLRPAKLISNIYFLFKSQSIQLRLIFQIIKFLIYHLLQTWWS
ncbi:Hypothetical_protein [Hexamita inflata]|uniref:Hypothetical_protein n=1 Tax=Hexamita inflata TaxID=28002 RepID=A0ABP1KY51_9EUKA